MGQGTPAARNSCSEELLQRHHMQCFKWQGLDLTLSTNLHPGPSPDAAPVPATGAPGCSVCTYSLQFLRPLAVLGSAFFSFQHLTAFLWR